MTNFNLYYMIDFAAIEKPQDLLGVIVIPKQGRDEGKPRVLIGWTPEGFALVADGKIRTAGKPKMKNMKHLRYTNYRSNEIWMRAFSGEEITDIMIREALNVFCKQSGVI